MDRLNADVAALRDDKAGISAAAAQHARNWPATWSARQNWRRLTALEMAARQAYQRAQDIHRRERTAAEAQHTQHMEYVERLGRDAGQREILSPFSGRVYHNAATYRPIEVGRRLPTTHLFNIPKGRIREFEIHVPARRYRDAAVDQELAFYLPAEGAKRRIGRIVHVADFFEKRSIRLDRSGMRGRAGDLERGTKAVESTVRVTVEFECDREDAAPPGMTVVVELDA